MAESQIYILILNCLVLFVNERGCKLSRLVLITSSVVWIRVVEAGVVWDGAGNVIKN